MCSCVRTLLFLLSFTALSYTAPALAQSQDEFGEEEDPFDFEDLSDAGDSPAPTPEADSPIEEKDDLDDVVDPEEGETDEYLDDIEADEMEFSLLDDEKVVDVLAPGVDTEALFRAQRNRSGDLTVDEAIGSWEGYLARYPNTLFKTQISDIVDGLMEKLYGQGIIGGGAGVDALDAEIYLTPGLLLENINPRTHLQAGFEWGFPSYLNLIVDYEQALRRDFSVHGGVRHRYSGWNFESGVRWAAIKSSRTQTILTLLGDIHFNTNPAYMGFRPQVALGKRFSEQLDIHVISGVDMEFPASGFGLRIVGGGHLAYRMSSTVGMFLESSFHMKNMDWNEGPFSFNTATFGLRFYPGEDNSQSEVSLGGTFPHSKQYWRYHDGALMGQANIWMD